jgi:alpha-D-xyloside xylohydrolase
MIRYQRVRAGETFHPDDWLPMIARHDLGGGLSLKVANDTLEVSTTAPGGVTVTLAKKDMTASWKLNGAVTPQLREAAPANLQASGYGIRFVPDDAEHFAGLGHGIYGRDAAPLDLKGRSVKREYAVQAVLYAPWFLSSKGYGVFVNSADAPTFRFDSAGVYDIQVSGAGAQVDYVVIGGATPLALIDRYTLLTGRPRMPRMGMFGLQLSNKDRETESLAQGEAWWKTQIAALRAANFPIDAIVMDNVWRAGGGTWGKSIFAFDPTRFPDPAEFETWAKANGLMVCVDFNQPMFAQEPGWQPAYAVSSTAPYPIANFFKEDVADWLWRVMWKNVLDPSLGFPNDMVWMDETDEGSVTDPNAPFFNGRPWRELQNLYAFAAAEALVSRWDKGVGDAKRPYFWFRSGTAGMQRYASAWSGDSDGTEADNRAQVAAMLGAGISGFPFFNHDAGGFHSITEDLYRRYAVVAGSLSPIWRPHGPGGPRWPTGYGAATQDLAHRYADLRYRLMPYIYSHAWEATQVGAPLTRALFLQFPDAREAWKRDFEYMFGASLLVAPPVASRSDMWLPPGTWYDYWTGAKVAGDQILALPANGSDAAIYVRAGAIVPLAPFALGIALQPADQREIHVWAGADGSFSLYEDDGVSEKFAKGERAITQMTWNDAAHTLALAAPQGTWPGAPANRKLTVVLHGLGPRRTLTVDGRDFKNVVYDPKIDALIAPIGTRSFSAPTLLAIR